MKKELKRRDFLKFMGAGMAGAVLNGCTKGFSTPAKKPSSFNKPNFIVIFCDDMGFGDIGCDGSTKHRTPNIDRMASEGTRFTSFYSTSGVCTPSRASLMTGCYPRRVNMHQGSNGGPVVWPSDPKGLNPNEITIADMLKEQGYATACIGKWHLGDQPEFLPNNQGFDYYFGIPYSNDMGPWLREGIPPIPLIRNEEVIEAPINQHTMTKRFTEETIKFITENKNDPFFVYLPHPMPHEPYFVRSKFKGKSDNGDYGDVIEEIDWSTGQILDALRKLGLDDNTLVIFTSDNGANRSGLTFKDRDGVIRFQRGSNLPFSGWKGSTEEGGMRMPCVMRYPGKIPAGRTCDELTTTMDILPTFAKISGSKVDKDRIIDGKDIWPIMAGEKGAKSPHQVFYYYRIAQLQAVRSGKWKLCLPLKNKSKVSIFRLYDVKTDLGEKNNLADKHPEVVKRLAALAEKAREELGDKDRPGKGQRPAGWVDNPKPMLLPKYDK